MLSSVPGDISFGYVGPAQLFSERNSRRLSQLNTGTSIARSKPAWRCAQIRDPTSAV